ncbi:hypothetical protein QBK99_03360 [Corticibacterium sp. UT-5YL-CI-8]|nr:hypothetical protein [Tianweitania sp. UT-5YL-CI-8]
MKTEIPPPPSFVPPSHHKEWRDLAIEMMRARGNAMSLSQAYWNASGWYGPVETVLGDYEEFNIEVINNGEIQHSVD